MKEAIEKAIKNGFNPTKGILEDYMLEQNFLVVYYVYQKGDLPRKHIVINIYRLIFGTDFIDKLVMEADFKVAPGYCPKCGRSTGKIINAHYHRSQMANIKDVEKLKEYVRGLI